MFARVPLLFALFVALLLPAPAFAGQSAEQFIRAKQAALSAALKGAAGDAKQKKIAGLFDSMLDYQRLAEGSLGKHWAERSAAERDRFTGVLTQLVQRAYRKNLDKTANYKIDYKGEVEGEDGLVVRTVATSQTNAREAPVSIDYVLAKKGADWRVHDIVTEGSSLVSNYRRQFSRIIKKDGFEALIEKMEKKLAEES
jgi:phospholipid transport system substrate-binding protein